jgi:hypothetical protein
LKAVAELQLYPRRDLAFVRLEQGQHMSGYLLVKAAVRRRVDGIWVVAANVVVYILEVRSVRHRSGTAEHTCKRVRVGKQSLGINALAARFNPFAIQFDGVGKEGAMRGRVGGRFTLDWGHRWHYVVQHVEWKHAVFMRTVEKHLDLQAASVRIRELRVKIGVPQELLRLYPNADARPIAHEPPLPVSASLPRLLVSRELQVSDPRCALC